MKPLIIYHANCTDGFGAAFAAWCKFGDDAEYLPMSYGQEIDRPVTGRDVYVLDFSFDSETTAWLLNESTRFVWLDHHKTAFEMWAPDGERERYTDSNGTSVHILLDNNKSGALLAWEYFHPKKDVPDLILRIDDRDRWVFHYEDSKALHAGLQRYGFNFIDWKYLLRELDYSVVVQNGRTILNVYNDQIRDRVRVAKKCKVPNYNVAQTIVDEHVAEWELSESQARAEMAHLHALPGLAVNSTVHASEIGNELAKASGTYGLIWYYDAATGRANVSLRSIGDYDVSAIAKAFGGGGHKNAAGFNIDMPTLLGWLK